MDSPEAPLIPEDQRNGELQYDADDADVETESGGFDKPEAKPGLFVLLLTFSAGISGLLFGCELSLDVVRSEIFADDGQMTPESSLRLSCR